jgi:hypothetical protein
MIGVLPVPPLPLSQSVSPLLSNPNIKNKSFLAGGRVFRVQGVLSVLPGKQTAVKVQVSARRVRKAGSSARNGVSRKAVLPRRETIRRSSPEVAVSGKDECKSGRSPEAALVRPTAKLLELQWIVP